MLRESVSCGFPARPRPGGTCPLARGYAFAVAVRRPLRRTKIVATIGPASDVAGAAERADRAGIDAAGSTSRTARTTSTPSARGRPRDRSELGRPIALIADLQGPKLRIGDLDEPVMLARGHEIVVVRRGRGADGDLPVAPAVIGDVLSRPRRPDRRRARPPPRREVEKGRARCAVVVGGLISSHKGVNLPGRPAADPVADAEGHRRPRASRSSSASTTSRSRSSARAADVRDLRALIEQAGSHAHVIAKIEKAEAVDALDDDPRRDRRGDGRARRPRRRDRPGPRAAPAEADHPRALERGKPVITATQMLESMIHSPGADPRRGERRRERDPRRHVRRDALRRDGGRRVPGRGRRVHGPDRARGRAEPRLPPRDPRGERRPDDRPGDVERGLRPRRGAAGERDPRPDVLRPHRVAPSRGCVRAARSSRSRTSTGRCASWRSSGA